MHYCKPSQLKRKQRKQAQMALLEGKAASEIDFLYSMAQTRLLADAQTCLSQTSAQHDAPQHLKGLLLYAQNNAAFSDVAALPSMPLSRLVFEQMPFSALSDSSSSLVPISTPSLSSGGDGAQQQYFIIMANLAFDWLDAGAFIRAMQPLLAPGGHLLFSSYGAQTAQASKAILAGLTKTAYFNDFYEMQDIGDALLGAGFKNVVVDSQLSRLEYGESQTLLDDAKRIFGLNLHPDRQHALTGKGRLADFRLAVDRVIASDGKFVEEVELLISYAQMPQALDAGGVSAAQIAVKMG